MPPDGAEIEAEYLVGGGSPGNVAAGSLTKILSDQPGLKVTQPFAAIGGAEAETLPEAKGRAVALLRCLKAEANAGKIRKLLSQLLEASKQIWHVSVGKG